MKNVTQNFKENIKKFGRQLDASITVDNETIDSERINNINASFNTGLFKTVMHVLEIDCNEKIEKDSVINARIGVKFANSNYEYVEYNNYKVKDEPEKQEDTKSYKMIAYDKMIESMIDYDLTNTEIITLRQYLVNICNRLGWETTHIPASFVNSNKNVSPALHMGIGYTFRDALDEIATISCSFMYFKGNNFYLGYPTETNITIDEEYLNAKDVTIGEKYFINSLVFSRAEESDNIYRKDDTSIEENGLHEYRVSDNQLLSTNNRDLYIDDMFSYLLAFNFYIYDVKSTGILFLDICDRFKFNINNQLYSTIMLNNEINVTQGLEERLYTDKPKESETEYKYADTTDKRINQTYFIVDKQNQVIESVVSNVTTQNNKISRVEQTVDELNSKISDIADITTSQETNTGSLIFEDINQSEPIHIEIRPLGENISYLYPFEQLYPANNLFIKLRTLRFTNTDTNAVFDYELPDDLLYYDSENYDEFILDYDSQTCYVNKKCAYDNNGEVILRQSELVEEFTFPHINLTDGDYTVQILKYDNVPYGAYLLCRLMAQNIYTTQFATKSELNSEISQTAESINLNVNQKLSNYSTTSQMNSAIAIKANEITSSVDNTLNNYSTTTQMNSAINQKADQITSTVSSTYETKISANDKLNSAKSYTDANVTTLSSRITQNFNSISAEVTRATNSENSLSASINLKVDKSDNGQIISMINASADRISLTAGRLVITSGNFKLDSNGNVTCTNINITSGKIKLTGGSESNPDFIIGNSNYDGCWIIPNQFGIYSGVNEKISMHTSSSNGVDFRIASDNKDCYVQFNLMNYGGRANFGVDNVYVYGTTHTYQLYYDSLESLKKNINKFESKALDIVNNSSVYEYNYKNQKDSEKKTIGFIIGDEGNDYNTPKEVLSNDEKGINSYSAIGILWKAIQELTNKVQELEKGV